jgi:hypothetical protein
MIESPTIAKLKAMMTSSLFPLHGSGAYTSAYPYIFHKLSQECKGNPHLSGKVKVTANDQASNRQFQAHDLIYETDKSGKWWATNNTAIDHYIKFEFPSSRICPSGYSLKAHNVSWSRGGDFIQSWRFEGSNDDSGWTTLDTQNGSDGIAGNDKAAFFPISTMQPYRFLRIITGSPTSSGCHQLSMQQIEVFGRVDQFLSL